MNCQQLFVNSSKGKKSALAKRASLHADVMDLFSGMPGPRLARSEAEFYMQAYKICRRKRSDNPYDNFKRLHSS